MIRKVLLVLAVFGVIGLMAWKLSSNKQKMKEDAAIASTKNTTFPVEVAEVKSVSISADFEGVGSFEPSKEMQFISETQGRVVSVNFKDGDNVREGQLLCKLDDEMLQNDLKAAQMGYDKALADQTKTVADQKKAQDDLAKVQADVARLEALLVSGGITQQQVIDARHGITAAQYGVTMAQYGANAAQIGVNAAKNKIDALKIMLKKTTINSPTSGIVLKRMVEKGSFLAPGAPIAAFAIISPIKLVAKVSEKEIPNIRIGMSVRVTTDAYTGKDLMGVVKLIGVKADDAKRFPIEIELSNPSGGVFLRGGMSGTAYFKRPNAISGNVIPRQAIVGSLQNAKVFVVDGENKVHEKRIVTGAVIGNDIEVAEGLAIGDRVVKSGQFNLSEGTKVTTIQ